ncbi:MAG: class I SAM-dependent methyltransferase [Chlorobi bacterium]|nr:class I SAM-dependent methyltransferase [Chlorobiota bacterium]
MLDEIFKSIINEFRKEIKKGAVEIIRDKSFVAVNSFKDLSLDWVYIDGNHLYEYVKQDLINFFPKIKIGGFITGDDYGIKGWWDDGVKKAVDEFIKNYNKFIKVVEINSNQFILQKISNKNY